MCLPLAALAAFPAVHWLAVVVAVGVGGRRAAAEYLLDQLCAYVLLKVRARAAIESRMIVRAARTDSGWFESTCKSGGGSRRSTFGDDAARDEQTDEPADATEQGVPRPHRCVCRK